MKKILRTLLIVPLAFTLTANAATVVWTNISGGAWGTAANWSPNQVPGSGDSAFITNNGDYTVTLDSGATVASIVLGASSGASTQTLAWTGGVLRDCVLTVSSRGVLSLSGAADKELANSTLNNGGTVIWSDPGALQARMVSSSLPPVLITNLAGGTFDVQNDAGFTFYNPGYGGTLTIRFHNAGILRKSGGVSVTSFAGQWQFENAGTVEVQQGALQFPNGFANTGAFDLATGTAVNLDGGIFSFAPGSLKTGAGALLVDDGSVTLTGTVPSLSWTGGALADSDFTVASNAVLAISGAVDKTLLGNSTMNNAGTVTWAGTGALLARMVHTKPLVLITNLAGGLFELQNDAGFTFYDLYGGGVARFHNAGTLRKTGGPGTTSFDSHWQVVNTGSLTVQQGTIVFPGFQNDGSLVVQTGASAGFPAGFVNNGIFDLNSGMVVNLTGGSFTFGPASQLLGGGQLVVPSGDVTLSGTVPSLSWTGGRLVDSDFTVASNAVLAISGAADKTLFGTTLRNAGTVTLSGAGTLQAKVSVDHPNVLVTNLAGGVFDLRSDAILGFSNPGYSGWILRFHNAGTLRKSGGTGAATFADAWNFINSGLLDVQTGTLTFTGDNTLIGGTLNFGLTSPSVFGKLTIPASANVRGIIQASLNSPNGLSAGNQFQVLNQGSRLRNAVVFAGRNLGNELVYDPVMSSSAVTLVLRATTHPTPPVVSLSYAPQLPAFVLMEGQAGQNYQLQASTDLCAWTSLQTNSAPTGVCEFDDPAAPDFDHRFYRLQQMP